MPDRILKSFRLECAIVANIDYNSEKLGISSTDYVSFMLSRAMDMKPDPRVALLVEVGSVLKTMVPEDQPVPPDIIRRVFLEIQHNPHLNALYRKALEEFDYPAQKDQRLKQTHQEVAQLVKRALRARSTGRAYIPGKDELIQSYALLERRPAEELAREDYEKSLKFNS